MGDRVKTLKYRIGGPDGDVYDVEEGALDKFHEYLDLNGLTAEPVDSFDAGPEADSAVDDSDDTDILDGKPPPSPEVERRERPRYDVGVGDALVEPEFVEPEEPAPAPAPVPPPLGRGQATDRAEPAPFNPWMQNALDVSMGLISGATFGGADDFVSYLDEGAGQLYREEMALARERSPWLFHGAEGVAGAPAALASGGVAGTLGLGALQGALSVDSNDLGDRAMGGLYGAGAAGVLHGAGSGIGATGRAAREAAPAWQATSNEMRNAVLGSPEDYQALAEKKGIDFAFDGPAEAVRELGMTNTLRGQSPYTYAKKAHALKNELGEEIGGNLEHAGRDPQTHVLRDAPTLRRPTPPPPPLDMSEELPPYESLAEPENTLSDQLLGQEIRDTAEPMAGRTPRGEYLELGDVTEQIDLGESTDYIPREADSTSPITFNDPTSPMSARQLAAHGVDEALEQPTRPVLGDFPAEQGDSPVELERPGYNVAGYPTRSMGGALQQLERASPNGTPSGQAKAAAYARLRGLLGEGGVDPVLDPKALNELKTRYHNDAFEHGKAGDMPSSITEQTSAGAGRAANDLILHALRKQPERKAAYEGAAKKYGSAALIEEMATKKAAGSQGRTGGGMWSTLNMPMTSLTKKYVPDFGANVAQLGANSAGRVGRAIGPKLSEGPRLAASLASAPLTQAAGRQAEPAHLRSAVLQALGGGADALGQWGEQLAQAASSPSPTAIDDEITRLIQTEPEFRTYILPMLRAGAVQQR